MVKNVKRMLDTGFLLIESGGMVYNKMISINKREEPE